MPRDLFLTDKVIEIGKILDGLDYEDVITVLNVVYESVIIVMESEEKVGADHDTAPKKE